jgi:hypothetical protein
VAAEIEKCNGNNQCFQACIGNHLFRVHHDVAGGFYRFHIIPESGPHLIFVMMYAQGLIPFSLLFTTSFVQDGHGMLPFLSYSLKDSVLIKLFNLIFGLAVGCILFALGL